MTTLPDKPSALIRIALGDLEKVENNWRYTINMQVWHGGGDGHMPCPVCLAGAVMAMSLGCDIRRNTAPYDFGEQLDNQLSALNNFRLGNITCGLHRLGHDMPDDMPHLVEVTPYDHDPLGFKYSMEKMIALFQQYDL